MMQLFTLSTFDILPSEEEFVSTNAKVFRFNGKPKATAITIARRR